VLGAGFDLPLLPRAVDELAPPDNRLSAVGSVTDAGTCEAEAHAGIDTEGFGVVGHKITLSTPTPRGIDQRCEPTVAYGDHRFESSDPLGCHFDRADDWSWRHDHGDQYKTARARATTQTRSRMRASTPKAGTFDTANTCPFPKDRNGKEGPGTMWIDPGPAKIRWTATAEL
jgi:hypothetical protein